MANLRASILAMTTQLTTDHLDKTTDYSQGIPPFTIIMNSSASLSATLYDIMKEINPIQISSTILNQQESTSVKGITNQARETDASPSYLAARMQYFSAIDESTKICYNMIFSMDNDSYSENQTFDKIITTQDLKEKLTLFLDRANMLSEGMYSKEFASNSSQDNLEAQQQFSLSIALAILSRAKDLFKDSKVEGTPLSSIPYAFREIFAIVDYILNPTISEIWSTYTLAEEYRTLITHLTSWAVAKSKCRHFLNSELMQSLARRIRRLTKPSQKLDQRTIREEVVSEINTFFEEHTSGSPQGSFNSEQTKLLETQILDALRNYPNSQDLVTALQQDILPSLNKILDARSTDVIVSILTFQSSSGMLSNKSQRVNEERANQIIEGTLFTFQQWLNSLESNVQHTMSMYQNYVNNPLTYVGEEGVASIHQKDILDHVSTHALRDVITINTSRDEEIIINYANRGVVQMEKPATTMTSFPLQWQTQALTRFESSPYKMNTMNITDYTRRELMSTLSSQPTTKSQLTLMMGQSEKLQSKSQELVEQSYDRLKYGQLKQVPKVASNQDMISFNNALYDIYSISKLQQEQSEDSQGKHTYNQLGNSLMERIQSLQITNTGQLLDRDPTHRIKSLETLILLNTQITTIVWALYRLRCKLRYIELSLSTSKSTKNEVDTNNALIELAEGTILQRAISTLQDFIFEVVKVINPFDNLNGIMQQQTALIPAQQVQLSLKLSSVNSSLWLDNIKLQSNVTQQYLEQQAQCMVDFALADEMKIITLWDQTQRKETIKESVLRLREKLYIIFLFAYGIKGIAQTNVLDAQRIFYESELQTLMWGKENQISMGNLIPCRNGQERIRGETQNTPARGWSFGKLFSCLSVAEGVLKSAKQVIATVQGAQNKKQK